MINIHKSKKTWFWRVPLRMRTLYYAHNVCVGEHVVIHAHHLYAPPNPTHYSCYSPTGADVNLKDRWGKSPLQISIKRNNPHVVKILQKSDASLDSSEAESDLFEAASTGNVEVMDILITNGVLVDVMDYDLRTPLHIAASMNQLTSINFLLSRKGNPNLKNR